VIRLAISCWSDLSHSERQEEVLFTLLLKICTGLKDRLSEASNEEVGLIADLVRPLISCTWLDISHIIATQIQKGVVNGGRSDDTKTMKSAVIDWITPPGQSLEPLLSRKIKTTCGFHHEKTGLLLCPAGLDWSTHQ
jgi:hypothetical protein